MRPKIIDGTFEVEVVDVGATSDSETDAVACEFDWLLIDFGMNYLRFCAKKSCASQLELRDVHNSLWNIILIILTHFLEKCKRCDGRFERWVGWQAVGQVVGQVGIQVVGQVVEDFFARSVRWEVTCEKWWVRSDLWEVPGEGANGGDFTWIQSARYRRRIMVCWNRSLGCYHTRTLLACHIGFSLRCLQRWF